MILSSQHGLFGVVVYGDSSLYIKYFELLNATMAARKLVLHTNKDTVNFQLLALFHFLFCFSEIGRAHV